MGRSFFLFIIFSLAIFRISSAQQHKKHITLDVPFPVCYASDKVEKSFTPPPFDLSLKSASEKTSDIVVNYSQFPPKAIVAFEYAVTIWEHIIQSDVPIHISANWLRMEEQVLGSSGPADYYTNFKNTQHKGRYYPVAVSERISKSELNGVGVSDIVSTFNKEQNWYFGTDGNTPDSLYDFVTVVLHEIAHGLGFTGFFGVDDNSGFYAYNNLGDASAFDLLVVNSQNQQLVNTTVYPQLSSKLRNALISERLFANSPVAISEGTGSKPRLYVPNPFVDGSSIYHLNEATHPNDLMNHAIGKGEAVHDPGPLVNGILADIGWKHMFLHFENAKDVEEPKPIEFNLSVESDYELDSASLFVIYTTDNFENHTDSLRLELNDSTNLFSAELNPGILTGIIEYYVTARDKLNREFRLPTEAPAELYKLKIGPDSQSPEISHNPIPYFILTNKALSLSANVNDNLGLDTVFVRYAINDSPPQTFGLSLESLNNYTGTFNFDLEKLNDGDIISYNIIAIDEARNQNTTLLPDEGSFAFKVEKIFEPRTHHFNNFNSPTTDFVISDFEITTPDNFEDGALHSPHPYPSPDQNNTFWDFFTLLKYPIILLENSIMTYDEVVLVEPGEENSKFGDDDFWDYAMVEGSKDMGKTWLPFADGYDSRDRPLWDTIYRQNISGNNSLSSGTSELYFNREIDLLENKNFNVGDTVWIRFRLFSDPYANGWGWAIDNLKIQIPVTSSYVSLPKSNIKVFPNPFHNVLNISVQTTKPGTNLELEFYNTLGKKLKSHSFRNVNGTLYETIDLAHFRNGIYLALIRENGVVIYSQKIIKN